MSIITSQQIARLYEQYKTSEVTFNRQVITATGLVSRNVFLKIQDRQLPCMILSVSLASAKVVASISSAVFTVLKQTNNRLLQAPRQGRTDHLLRDVPRLGFHPLRGAGSGSPHRDPGVHAEAAG